MEVGVIVAQAVGRGLENLRDGRLGRSDWRRKPGSVANSCFEQLGGAGEQTGDGIVWPWRPLTVSQRAAADLSAINSDNFSKEAIATGRPVKNFMPAFLTGDGTLSSALEPNRA